MSAPWEERWYLDAGSIVFPEDGSTNKKRIQLAVYAPELYRQLHNLLADPSSEEARRKAEKVLRHARGEYPDSHGQWAGDDEL